jgi:fusion and transport protein UGO1
VSLVEIFIKLPLETVLRRGHVATLATSHHSTAQTSSGRKQAPPLLPLHATGMSPRLRTIVPVGPYKGIFGTLRYIIHEEGTRPISSVPSTPRIATATSSSAASQSQQQQRGRQQQLEPRRGAQKQERRGQGLKGTIRGWRFGFWALIGVYATAGLSASGQQEF